MNRKKPKTILCFLLIICTNVLFFGCKNSETAELLERKDGMEADVITIGIQANAQFLPLYIAKEKNYIEDALSPYGISVVWNEYNTAIPLNRAINGGICDMGIMGDVPAVLGVSSYGKTNIIGMTSHAPDNYVIVVKKDSDIKSPEDLQGKNVGTVYGSTAHLFLKTYLEGAGLSMEDINLSDINVGNILSYLEKDELDAVVCCQPHAARTVGLGVGEYLAKGSDAGLFGGFMFVARKDYTEKNFNTLRIVLEQYKKASGEVSDMSDEYLDEIATVLSINNNQLKEIIPYFDFSEMAVSDDDIKGIQKTCDFLEELDIIPERMDAGSFIDRDIITAGD